MNFIIKIYTNIRCLIYDFIKFLYYRIISLNDILLRKKLLNIVSVIEGKIPSTELGVDIPLKWLSINKKCRHYSIKANFLNFYHVLFADIIFFMRNIENNSINIFDLSKKLNKKIIYGIDDDFDTLSEEHPLKQYMLRNGLLNNYHRFLKESNVVCVYSQYFQKKLLKLNNNVFYLSNIAPIEIIKNLEKKININKSNKIRIGYLGSSPQHIKFFNIIKNAVLRILEEYHSEVEFYLIGIKDEALDKYKNAFHVSFLKPINKYYEYMIKNKWDIGLAPMLDTEFEKAKTDNKYREYAALGIPGIYSNLEPFKNSVRNNITGILVDNEPEKWYQAIKELILNKKVRNNIAVEAYNDVLLRYNIETYANSYFKVINQLFEKN